MAFGDLLQGTASSLAAGIPTGQIVSTSLSGTQNGSIIVVVGMATGNVSTATLSGFTGSTEVTITDMNYPGEIQSNTSYTCRVWYKLNATPGDYTFTWSNPNITDSRTWCQVAAYEFEAMSEAVYDEVKAANRDWRGNPIVAAEKPTSSKDGFYFFLSVQACADFTDGGVDSWPTICPTDAHHATRVGPIIGGSKWNPTLGSPNVQAWLGWAGTYKYSDYHHIYDYVSILNSGYVGAPGGYGIKALAFSNGALHFDTPEYGTDNPDTFIHVRDSGTSVFGAGTSTSLSTSNGAAGNLLLACVATDGDMGAIVSDDWLTDGFTLAYADSTLRCYYKRLTTTYVGTNHTVTWTNSVSRNSCYVECKNMVGDTPTFVSSPPKHEMSYASLDTNFDHYIEAGESHDDGDGRLWILFMGNNGYSGTGGTPSTGVPEMIPSFESNPSTGADISWKTLAAGPRSSSQSAYIRAVAVQGSYRPYAMGWHTGAFASGAGNNEGILMVWRYAYTGPSAAWAHGEAPAWT